ncbi:PSD1 and planctomycete cytochrome C domain-containing protein [soil metagenome]
MNRLSHLPSRLPGLGLLIFCFTSVPAQASPADDADAFKFFEAEVRPILVEQCLKCHGPDQQKGGLRLDSLAAMLEGGKTGSAVLPGDLEESLLVEAVRYEGFEMPPTGPLPAEQVEILVRWVEQGAHWPGPGGEASGPEPVVREFITDEDRAFWTFQPVVDPEVPDVSESLGTIRNPIDRFILDRLVAEGLTPAEEADKRSLIRRATFDLHGLPPTPEEVEAFLADDAPDAFENLIDRLLDSPQYGERWARHWLDLVRYAESNGYRADEYRPHTYRYRDYVIDSFNNDKPYDQFVREQIAGDELLPDDPIGKVATGYLRLWVYESNQRDVEAQWAAILNDVTDVTADVFLGLGMGCARCHDHKYDPILQKDYFRLQAFFTPILPRDDLTLLPDPGPGVLEQQAAWEVATAEIRAEMADLEKSHREKAARSAIEKFIPQMQAMIRKPIDERDPREHQLAELAYRQVLMEFDKQGRPKSGEAKERWDELNEKLAEFDHLKPDLGPPVETISDVGPVPPPTIIPGDRSEEDIAPGFLTLLDPEPAEITPPTGWPSTTGRRTVLADWLTRPDNMLTTRVIVNRLWQYHFGRGLVETASDFGRLGEPPTHPELLDWLTSRFLEQGWSLKSMHRLIMTSATYRQTALRPTPDEARMVDPGNLLLWRMPIRRLEAEPIRDAMLVVSGELDDKMGGPAVEASKTRRTIYTKVLRNKRDPLLDAFDGADGFLSTSRRNVTITPTQSLLLINGPWVLKRAEAFSKRLLKDKSLDDQSRIELAYSLAFSRGPEPEETADALAFLRDPVGGQSIALNSPKDCEPEEANSEAEAEIRPEAWVDFCHALLNSNEFLYVD